MTARSTLYGFAAGTFLEFLQLLQCRRPALDTALNISNSPDCIQHQWTALSAGVLPSTATPVE